MSKLQKTKVVFIGNVLGGDDGIGPYLFNELKDNPALHNFDLLELGVIGLDLIPYVEEADNLIIVDALYSEEKEIGEIIVLGEKDLSTDMVLISQHDFDVEKTLAVLRAYKPELGPIKIIGIAVKKIDIAKDKLSEQMMDKLPEIKKKVVDLILELKPVQ